MWVVFSILFSPTSPDFSTIWKNMHLGDYIYRVIVDIFLNITKVLVGEPAMLLRDKYT